MTDIDEIEHNVEGAANLFRALSNEKRLMIVCELSKGEKSVGELENIIGLSQSALSQHLAKLRKDKIVHTRRSAQTIYYSLADRATQSLLSCLQEVYVSAQSVALAKAPRMQVAR